MFDAKKVKIVNNSGELPPDVVIDGIIVEIIGDKSTCKIRDLVKKDYLMKWEGSEDKTAIEVIVEVKNNDKAVHQSKIFTYEIGNNGEVEVMEKSNLAKFNAKYGKYPEVGMKVKVATDGNGYGKIKID